MGSDEEEAMPHEFDGRKYEQASAHQKEWGRKLIAELALRGDERVLDLGCGDGTLTAILAGLLPRGSVLGIDSSKGMIAAARAREAGNLAFSVTDIGDIAFEDEFDVVFSNATLHWVKDHRSLLANVHAALRKDGTARFNFAGEGNCSRLIAVVRRAVSDPRFARHFLDFEWPWYMPGIEEYRRLVGESPFGGGEVWGENADRVFPDADALIRWIDQPSIVPFISRVPEEAKEEFRASVVDAMLSETLQEGGGYFETFRRINLRCRK